MPLNRADCLPSRRQSIFYDHEFLEDLGAPAGGRLSPRNAKDQTFITCAFLIRSLEPTKLANCTSANSLRAAGLCCARPTHSAPSCFHEPW